MTPEQESFAVCEIRRRKIGAEGIAEAGVFVPVADVRRRYPVGTAEQIKKAAKPAFDIVHRSAASGAFSQGDGFSAVALANCQNAPRDIIERFVPADSLPAGIGIALWPRAFERIIEPIGMVNQLRRGFAFDAHNAAVGMIVIGIEPDDSAVLDGRDGGAVGRAQRAVAAYSAGGLS